MVAIYYAFNSEDFPTRQFTEASDTFTVDPFSIIPARLARSGNFKLAIVPQNPAMAATVASFIADMTLLYPPLNGSTIGGTGFTSPALRSVFLPGFVDCITTFDSEELLATYIASNTYDTAWEENSRLNPKIWGAIVFNRGTKAGNDVDYS